MAPRHTDILGVCWLGMNHPFGLCSSVHLVVVLIRYPTASCPNSVITVCQTGKAQNETLFFELKSSVAKQETVGEHTGVCVQVLRLMNAIRRPGGGHWP